VLGTERFFAVGPVRAEERNARGIGHDSEATSPPAG
jgi:hypothetical protein